MKSSKLMKKILFILIIILGTAIISHRAIAVSFTSEKIDRIKTILLNIKRVTLPIIQVEGRQIEPVNIFLTSEQRAVRIEKLRLFGEALRALDLPKEEVKKVDILEERIIEI